MFRRRILAAAMAVLLVFSSTVLSPKISYADTTEELKSKLVAAQEKLDTIYAEAEKISEDLNGTKEELASTESQIADINSKIESNQQEIDAKQEELSGRQSNLTKTVSDDYKSGGVDFIAILLDSTSFEDFISRVHYAQKVSNAKAQNIEETRNLKLALNNKKAELSRNVAELQEQKDAQQKLVDSKQAKSDELDAKVAEAEDYVDSLDSKVKDALAKEEEERAAAAAAAAEEARKQHEQESQSQSVPEDSSESSGQDSSSEDSSDSDGVPSTPDVPSSGSARDTVINAAFSMIGGRYVWGASDPYGKRFDCSGLVKYCFSCAGISLPHYSGGIYNRISKKYNMSEWQPGDIIYWSGHVGIYVGSGMMVDAASPSIGISYRKVDGGWVCAGWPQ